MQTKRLLNNMIQKHLKKWPRISKLSIYLTKLFLINEFIKRQFLTFEKYLQVTHINGDAWPRAILSSVENEVLEIVPQALLRHSYEISTWMPNLSRWLYHQFLLAHLDCTGNLVSSLTSRRDLLFTSRVHSRRSLQDLSSFTVRASSRVDSSH